MTLALRREGRSLAEITRALKAAGTPLGRTAIWEVVGEEGLGRLPVEAPQTASGALLAPKAQRLQAGDWPQEGTVSSEHAGLFLLVPELLELDVPALLAAADYPGTQQLTAVNSLLALLALKLYERRRRSHVYDVVHDTALGVFCGLSALPKRSHLSGYSYRTTRAQNRALLQALVARQQAMGLIDGESFNLDFHAIMSYGEGQILEEHYVPRRSQRTCSCAGVPPRRHARDALLRQHRHRQGRPSARDHPLLRVLAAERRAEARAVGVRLDAHDTRRARRTGRPRDRLYHPAPRGGTLMDQIAKLPEDAWQAVRLERPGKHRDVTVAEMTATIAKHHFRQLAVNGLGRDQPTLLLTNQHDLTAKRLIERYAKRWIIENQLAAQIRAFHIDALTSQVPLAVDLDTTLSVLCDNIYRMFARRLHNGYETATPDTIFRHFIEGPGELQFTPNGINVALRARAHTPVLLDAGYQQLTTTIPWWDGRQLSYSFPPA